MTNRGGGVVFIFQNCLEIPLKEVDGFLRDNPVFKKHYSNAFGGYRKISKSEKDSRLKQWTSQEDEVEKSERLKMKSTPCPWMKHFNQCPILKKQHSCPFGVH